MAKSTNNNNNNKRKHKRRWILKKSVRMSLASFFMILALVVAAIPAPVSRADTTATGYRETIESAEIESSVSK